MKLILCRKPSLGSLLLRAYMGSRWSHAAIWDDEARKVHDTTLTQGGCKTHDEAEFFSHYRLEDSRVIDLPVHDLAQARAWLAAQDGKGYDWMALVGILFRTGSWADDRRWFCSEELAAFFNDHCWPLFHEQAARITPYHLDLLTDGAYVAR